MLGMLYFAGSIVAQEIDFVKLKDSKKIFEKIEVSLNLLTIS